MPNVRASSAKILARSMRYRETCPSRKASFSIQSCEATPGAGTTPTAPLPRGAACDKPGSSAWRLSRGQAGDSRRRVVTGVGYLRAGEAPPPAWLFSKKGGGPFFRFSFWMHGAPDAGTHFHPGGNPEANLKSISHSCHPILVVFVWKLTKETIHLPLGCLQVGSCQ